MPFPKKKEKKTSPQLEYLRKQREREWDNSLKNMSGSLYPTLEEKKELERLRKKYGIKPKKDT